MTALLAKNPGLPHTAVDFVRTGRASAAAGGAMSAIDGMGRHPCTGS